MTQLSLIPIDPLRRARVERDGGMQQALEHAEEQTPKWGDVAYHFLENFCRNNRTFISEDVSNASRTWGMEQPPTDRAWGAVYLRAAKAGIIVQDGTGRSARRHASICPKWRSMIFGSPA